jgi:hypothetical protein
MSGVDQASLQRDNSYWDTNTFHDIDTWVEQTIQQQVKTNGPLPADSSTHPEIRALLRSFYTSGLPEDDIQAHRAIAERLEVIAGLYASDSYSYESKKWVAWVFNLVQPVLLWCLSSLNAVDLKEFMIEAGYRIDEKMVKMSWVEAAHKNNHWSAWAVHHFLQGFLFGHSIATEQMITGLSPENISEQEMYEFFNDRRWNGFHRGEEGESLYYNLILKFCPEYQGLPLEWVIAMFNSSKQLMVHSSKRQIV